MYHTKITGDRLYHTSSQGYGQPVELFGQTTDGETPVSLLNIALAACLTMCAQSYFKTQHQLETLDMELTSDLDYERKHFTLTLTLTLPSQHQLTLAQEADLRAHMITHCRVKTFFSEQVQIEIDVKYVGG